MKTHFDQAWKDWLITNINNGQNRDGLFKILLDEGFEFNAIAKEMKYLPSVPLEQLVNPFHAAKKLSSVQLSSVQQGAAQFSSASKKPPLSILPNKLFRDKAKKLPTKRLELYTLENFLSPQECEKIITLITSKLRPSGLSSIETDSSFRTSRTCDLGTLNDPFMQDIDDRICQLIGIDAAYSEVVQGQYYQIGQQFKAHTDYFEAHEIGQYGGQMGQRTYTLMIYLNEVEAGGETEFVNLGIEFKPQQGMAVIWNNLYPDGSTNIDSMHFAKPIIKGHKAVITKWFRSNSKDS